MEIGQEKAEIVAILNLLSDCETSLGVGSSVEGRAVICVKDYTTQQTGPESTALPRRYRLSKIGPKSVLFVCPEPFVFSGIFVTGTKGKKYGFVCNAKLRVLQKRRDTPSSSIARAATAGYRCRWHRRSRSCS